MYINFKEICNLFVHEGNGDDLASVDDVLAWYYTYLTKKLPIEEAENIYSETEKIAQIAVEQYEKRIREEYESA